VKLLLIKKHNKLNNKLSPPAAESLRIFRKHYAGWEAATYM